MATSKDFSIAIYGATGFTGKLVAGYLAETTDLTLALAARSKDKLDALAADLRQDYPSARFELFPVALDDREGLVSLFRRAKVVASLAGPYNRLGTPVLQAAIDAGAHYVDLTGELIWMKRMQATFEASAKAKGVAIVHSCGCDSIPYDLPTYWAAKALQEKTGSRSAALGRVRTGLFADGGSFSGGTFASVLDLVSTSTWSELYEAVYNPYILSPVKGKLASPALVVRESGRYGGLWPAGVTNRALVYKTAFLLEKQASKTSITYGPHLQYDDYLQLPSAGGPFLALFVSVVVAVSAALMATVPPLRYLVARFGPQSGSGPSKSSRDRTTTIWTTHAYTVDRSAKAEVILRAKGDAGYKATSGLISEAAIALTKRPADTEAGFLTPALALGHDFLEQLNRTDMFDIKVRVM